MGSSFESMPGDTSSAADPGGASPWEGHFSVQWQEHQPHLVPGPQDPDPEWSGTTGPSRPDRFIWVRTQECTSKGMATWP